MKVLIALLAAVSALAAPAFAQHHGGGLPFEAATYIACAGFIAYEIFRILNRGLKTNVADIACIAKFALMPIGMSLFGWAGMLASVLVAGAILALPQFLPALRDDRI